MAHKHKKKVVKKAKLFRSVVILLLLVGGIISICLFAPFFNVTEVAVSGNVEVNSEEILNNSGIVLGTNIFKADTNEAKKNLAKISRLDEIKVERSFPSRINIVVTETAPEIIIPYMSGYVITNEKGKVIELRDDVSDLTLPQVSGIEITEAVVCEKVSVKDKVVFEMIIECIRLFKEEDVLKDFRSLDFTNLSNFNGVRHDGLKVIFGKLADLEYKLDFLAGILPNVEKAEGTYVDISTSASGIYGNIGNEETIAPDEDESSDEDGEEATEETKTPDDSEENEMGEQSVDE